jgi:hypothetical protein
MTTIRMKATNLDTLNDVFRKGAVLACIFFVGSQLRSFGMEESEIIPQFYQILLRKSAPSIENERLFFGGKECSAVREGILKKERYSESKTPIWDFVKDHRDLFLTKNAESEDQFHAIISKPFDSIRSWNGNVIPEKRVYVSFAEQLDISEKSGVSGFASITFSLGKDCYINIGATTVCRSSSKAILNSVFGPDVKK